MNQWISALAESSYEKKREQLINLQIKLRSTTGIDPLGKLGTTFFYNFHPVKEHYIERVFWGYIRNKALKSYIFPLFYN